MSLGRIQRYQKIEWASYILHLTVKNEFLLFFLKLIHRIFLVYIASVFICLNIISVLLYCSHWEILTSLLVSTSCHNIYLLSLLNSL